MKILMLRGLPASGKSTFARELVSKDPSWVRVNKDDLRAMIHDSQWSKANEKVIVNARNSLVRMALVSGKSVIVDDTNFSAIHEQTLREIAREFGAEFETKDFDTSLNECLMRDAKRDKPVGKSVIMRMYNQYLAN